MSFDENIDDKNFTIRNGKAYTEDDVLVYNVFLYGLPVETTIENLKFHLLPYGKATKINLIKSKYGSLKFAFVNFADPLEASKLLSENKLVVLDKICYARAGDSWKQPMEAQLAEGVDARTTSPEVGIKEFQPEALGNILVLNDDCLEHICKLLPLSDQVQFARSCRRFREVFQMTAKVEQKVFFLNALDELTLWETRDLLQMCGATIETIKGTIPWKDRDRIAKFIANFCTNLKYCYLDGTELRSKPLNKFIQTNTTIKELHLSDCCIRDNSIYPISRLPQLECLNLSHNYNLTGKNLANLRNLKELNLYACDNLQTNYFKKMCQKLTELKKLDIRRCERLSPYCLKEVVGYLGKLEDLKISCQKGDYDSIAQLPCLKNLHIYASMDIVELPAQLFRALKRHKSEQLEELIISGYNILTENIIFEISKLKKLKSLSVPNNDFLDDNCLSELCNLTALEELTLSNCARISNTGLMILMRSCPKITYLDVKHCRNIDNLFVFDLINLLKSRKAPLQQPIKLFLYRTRVTESILFKEAESLVNLIYDNDYFDEFNLDEFDDVVDPLSQDYDYDDDELYENDLDFDEFYQNFGYDDFDDIPENEFYEHESVLYLRHEFVPENHFWF